MTFFKLYLRKKLEKNIIIKSLKRINHKDNFAHVFCIISHYVFKSIL